MYTANNNGDDLRKFIKSAIFMIASLSIIMWFVVSMSGCSSHRKTVNEHHERMSKIESVSSTSNKVDIESCSIRETMDSVSMKGYWSIVVFDTDKAQFDSISNVWNSPILMNAKGGIDADLKRSDTQTDTTSCEIQEERISEISGDTYEFENDIIKDDDKSSKYSIIAGIAVGLAISVLIVGWCNKMS